MAITPKSEDKYVEKCSTAQSFIRTEISTYRIGTLVHTLFIYKYQNGKKEMFFTLLVHTYIDYMRCILGKYTRPCVLLFKLGLSTHNIQKKFFLSIT